MEDSDSSRRRFLAVCGTALSAGIAGCSDSILGGDPEDTTPVDPDPSTPAPDPGGDGGADGTAGDFERFDADADSSYADVYRSTVGSVAQIQVYTGGPSPSQGTGFVYSDGHVVTNQHVVEGAESIYLRFDDSGWLDATVRGTDVYSDLAVLSVEELPESAEPLALRESDPAVGTEVIAIGNPFGYSGSVSAGIVSGVDRTLPAANDFTIPDAIQTDAPVNPGNSGGPLVTLDGSVAGVVNAGGGDNIGFAISAPLVRQVVPSLLETGGYEHSYMGVRLQTVGPHLAEANGVDERVGVYIAVVRDGGPSDGVLRGTTGSTAIDGQSVDTGGDVVVALDDTTIRTSRALSSFLALETSPGDTIDVTVLRDGEEQTVELTLGSRPDPT
ncbi:S1C family serine protease [Halosimplex pelagicum]|uniref:Trypsin-like peptidase domain-containing protein n=1 Tax=Halosimplex pelagicum TaxID=869886 RepID=A0A7D5PDG5_9EURY|nr:trypsin-like peptidase domain-containing protein [Halosimplex pelagicum]QLH83498.1 trypsin-like peptidase domain-containing protein [Halosimplex pelagicum]